LAIKPSYADITVWRHYIFVNGFYLYKNLKNFLFIEINFLFIEMVTCIFL